VATFDTASSSSTGSGSSLSFSHNIGAGNNRVLVMMGATEDDAKTITNATYDGEAGTEAVETSNTAEGNSTASLWYLLEADLPASGSHPVQFTYSNGSGTDMSGHAYAFDGRAQEAPESTASANGDADADLDVTGVSANAVIVDFIANDNSSSLDVGASQTGRFGNLYNGEGRASSSREPTTAGTFNMEWINLPSSADWSHVAASFAPVAVTDVTLGAQSYQLQPMLIQRAGGFL